MKNKEIRGRSQDEAVKVTGASARSDEYISTFTFDLPPSTGAGPGIDPPSAAYIGLRARPALFLLRFSTYSYTPIFFPPYFRFRITAPSIPINRAVTKA